MSASNPINVRFLKEESLIVSFMKYDIQKNRLSYHQG